MAVEAFPHQDALEIRMAVEVDAHHVEGLALMPVSGLPHRGHGRYDPVRENLQTDASIFAKRIEHVGDPVARPAPSGILRVIDAGEVDQIVEAVVLEGL